MATVNVFANVHDTMRLGPQRPRPWGQNNKTHAINLTKKKKLKIKYYTDSDVFFTHSFSSRLKNFHYAACSFIRSTFKNIIKPIQGIVC